MRTAASRGELVDGNAEWLFYQTVVGAWPLGVDRALAYMEKATKEAKVHTSWTDPNKAYDDAVAAFVGGALGDAAFIAAVESFVAPRCRICGGLLKPDVVFFGENVPGNRYAAARDALARADALLVAGSSLMVYSGFRFVRLAHEAALPIAIVNRGRTRGDDMAEIKVEGDVGAVMAEAVGSPR